MCYNLERIILPKSLTNIGEYFAYRTHSIKEIDIPESLISIGARFCYNSGIRRVIVRSSISTFAGGTYFGSDGLVSVIFTQPVPTSVMKNFIKNWMIVYVPDQSIEAYKSALGTSKTYKLLPLSEYPGSL